MPSRTVRKDVKQADTEAVPVNKHLHTAERHTSTREARRGKYVLTKPGLTNQELHTPA